MSGRIIDAGLTLLDRQLLDSEQMLAGKIDDLELTIPEGGGPPVVTAILAGPGALASRLGPRFGRLVEVIAARLRHPEEAPGRISFGLVKRIDSAVRLSVPRGELDTDRAESLARDHLVRHIPGSGHAPQ
ncbi:MAG TPA: hypothetical protein VF995_01140 [Actinomycetota bacterium]